MKKFFIILFLTAFSSAYAGGHLSEKDKKADGTKGSNW